MSVNKMDRNRETLSLLVNTSKHVAIIEALSDEPLLARGHFDANGEWCGKIVADAQSMRDLFAEDMKLAGKATHEYVDSERGE